MQCNITPNGRSLLTGSLPLTDPEAAVQLVLQYAPQIPIWPQLPAYPQEGMLTQFLPGMPGVVQTQERTYVDTAGSDFDTQIIAFFEEYLMVTEGTGNWEDTRFKLTRHTAQGFFALMDTLHSHTEIPFAVKGQITGPITFCTALTDQDKRAVFYNSTLRDAAIKLLALKAAWQVKQLSCFKVPVIIFIDEPALAGYGSSEFISISREDIRDCLEETITAIHNQGGLAGVHVCANTDWSLLLDSSAEIINFDAFGYFDKFMLYGEKIKNFIQAGRLLAWGLVPTFNSEDIESADLDTLWQDWTAKVTEIKALGIDADQLRAQSFITPSCGVGSLTLAQAQKVLELTQALSQRVQQS